MKIVVIGAGIAGLSIGWRLAQSGAEVTVLERSQPGSGATGASAGMIAIAAADAEGHTPLSQFAHRSAALWPHFAREIEESCGMDIGYRVDGALLLARTPEEEAVMRARAKGSASLEYLVAEQARALEPLLATDICGALFDPTEAQVDNRAIGSALAGAFQRAEGVLQTNETAVRIEVERGRASSVRTPFAHYHADAIVLAAGAWSSRIEGLPQDAVPAVIPVKGEMIALASERDPIPQHMIWGSGIYLVPRGECIFAGATVSREGFDSATTDAAGDWLLECAAAVMPTLGDWDLVEHWAGLRPGSPDDMPLIGPAALDGLFVASGQFRNGILLAPAIAEAMTAIVLGQSPREDIRAFDPRRFNAMPKEAA